jgi:signal transduction histidine kinase
MSKRSEFESSDTQEMQALPAAAAAAPTPTKKSDDEKVHIFWRVFGGAIISVAAFAGFTLYNTLTSNLAELRVENSRLREDVTTFRTRADDNRREIDAMKERLSKYRLEMDAAKKDAGTATEGVRKDVTTVEKELQKALTEVREKLARLEGQQMPMKAEK